MKRVLAVTGKPSTAPEGTSRLAPLTTGPLSTHSFPQKRPHVFMTWSISPRGKWMSSPFHKSGH